MSQLPTEVEQEITAAVGPCMLVPFSHPEQRNRTFLVRSDRVQAIAKLYSDVGIGELQEIGRAEALVRDAGVRVPALLFQSTTVPLVLHELLPGVHRQPEDMDDIQHCADWFQIQHDALRSVAPLRLVKRPSAPPRRARVAGDQTQDPVLRSLIGRMWQRLSELADYGVHSVSHTDWRTDNFLYHHGRLFAVLDWESIVRLPAGEAAGYAAASITHSWRDNLYTAFEVGPANAFADALRRRAPLLKSDVSGMQLRVATAFTAAVRLCEDRARGVAKCSITEILDILEADDLP